jgi:hypothetical protein
MVFLLLDEDEDPIPKEKKRRKSRKIVHVGGSGRFGWKEKDCPHWGVVGFS